MAKENWVKLFAPDGSPVEVLDTATNENEVGRVEILKGRGYTTNKPRNPTKSGNTGDSPEMAQMRAEMDALKVRNSELESATTAPEFAAPQTTPKK